MIIIVFGKSGTGKSYLSHKLASDLPNSIHIDLDILNGDLMKTDAVIDYATQLFGNKVLTDSKLSKQYILNCISSSTDIRNKWVNYMRDVCNQFLIKYIAATHFDYYILDHIISNTLNIQSENVLTIECVCDDATRLHRLATRDNIDNDVLAFRDQGYTPTPANLTYDSTNYSDILSGILSNNHR